MSEFQKEHRYEVFKLKNLTEDQKQRLYDLRMELGPWNDVGDCVVVESDWPNYQDTWADIQAVSEGRYVSRAELQNERDDLEARLEAMAVNRDAFREAAYKAISIIQVNKIRLPQGYGDECLAEIRAEAVEKFSSALASRVEVPDASPTKIEYYKAAIRHVLQFASGYAAKVRQGGAE